MVALNLYLRAERGRLTRLASNVHESSSYLSQIAVGRRPCPPILAVRIERSTGGAVKRSDLLPELWREIWPELVDQVAVVRDPTYG